MQGRGPKTMAFLVRAMIGSTFASLAAGAERVASENNHLLFISNTRGSAKREADLIATLREQRVGAVLLVGSTPSDTAFDERVASYAKDLGDVGASLVLCGRPPVNGHPELIAVDYDHAAGIAMAVDELIRLGHRQVAYVGEARGTTTAELRLEGFLAATRRNGREANPGLIRLANNSEDDGARAVAELLAGNHEVTAIVAMTDNIAVGAYRAARQAGRRIPEDLSVVGFDDAPVVGDLTPGLTTVRPPFYDVGVRAAEIALGLTPARSVLIEPTFVRRGSTGIPPEYRE
ncbi:MAG: substrate-binding domain-containing protein [Leifsonia sp.]